MNQLPPKQAFRLRFTRLVFAMSVFAGCAADLKTTAAVTAVGDPSGTAATTTVGAAGGTVRSADGKLELVVPAGALTADTALSVTPISVTAPGGVRSWRLGPEGTTFSKPATLKLTFSDADLGGSKSDALRVAFQDADHHWKALKASTVDATSITVTTTHFSDWSLLLGWQLRPPAPTVQVNTSVSLSVRFCNVVDSPSETELVSLVAECQDDEGLAPIIGAWAVNGIGNGNSELGTIAPGSPTATYTAPSKAPSPASVAVSVEFNPPKMGKVLLISNVTVGDSTPRTYAGTLNYHLHNGGTGTSILPYDYRVEAHVTLTRHEEGSRSYDIAGTAVLQLAKDTQVNCHCVASSVSGEMNADTLAFTARDGVVTDFSFASNFLAPVVCTGSTDPSCVNTGPQPAVPAWSLGVADPRCAWTQSVSFTNPQLIDGSWNMTCPVDTATTGRIEEVRWSLVGAN